MVKDNQYQQKHNFKCLQFLFFFSFLKKYIQFLTGDFWKPPRKEKALLHNVSWQQLLFLNFLQLLFSCLGDILYSLTASSCAPFSFSLLKAEWLNIPMNLHHKIPCNRMELCGLEVGMDSKKRSTGKTEIPFHCQGTGKVLEHWGIRDWFYPLPNTELWSNSAFSEKPSLVTLFEIATSHPFWTLNTLYCFSQGTLGCWAELAVYPFTNYYVFVLIVYLEDSKFCFPFCPTIFTALHRWTGIEYVLGDFPVE